MKFTVSFSPTKNTDCLVVFSDQVPSFDEKIQALIRAAQKDNPKKDEEEQFILIHSYQEFAKHILLVSHGTEEMTKYRWLTLSAKIGQQVKETNAKTFTMTPPRDVTKRFGMKESVQGFVEGVTLGLYTFSRYKKEQKKDVIEEGIIHLDTKDLKDAEEGIRVGQMTSRAVTFVRDLVNEPSSVTTPTFLALTAQSIAKENPLVTCEVLETKDMKRLGMGGILGIAKGSDEDPKFIRLAYKGTSEKTIVLVGKGITFDSGGLSLKPDTGMETMKMDMAGAATVLGIFSALKTLKPKVNIVGLIASCENMPSGKAIKPGDVVTALNGKTIEIVNTDAEGRVILADALSYASKFEKPDALIDLATLTGACMVALGEEIAGLFANNETLAKDLQSSAGKTGERIWEMPLVPEYRELIKGNVGDVKNSAGKKYGGAITAALFLQEFVGADIAWAHLDIAGPAFEEKKKALTPYGGTGFGVRMLLDYIAE